MGDDDLEGLLVVGLLGGGGQFLDCFVEVFLV